MFSRPWFFLLRRQVLIHRRLLVFGLTVAAVLLGWRAFVTRPTVIQQPPAATAAPSAASVPPGWVRMPVRFADGEMAALLHPGERIQLWATDPRAARSIQVSRDAIVIAIPETSSSGILSAQRSRLVVVGVRVTEVNKVTISGVGGFLTYALDR